MRKLLILFLLLPLTSFPQDFTQKEIKRFEKVLKRSNSTIREFEKNSLVSVERIGNSEIEGLIENALSKAGFEVVSNTVVKNAAVGSRTSSNKSRYLITVSGHYYKGTIIGPCQRALLSFSARIVDLKDEGMQVGTFNFKGKPMTYVACEDDVANAFLYTLQQLSDRKSTPAQQQRR